MQVLKCLLFLGAVFGSESKNIRKRANNNCYVPPILNGGAVTSALSYGWVFKYNTGDQVARYETVRVICEMSYNLQVNNVIANTITCKDNGWDRPFPRCDKNKVPGATAVRPGEKPSSLRPTIAPITASPISPGAGCRIPPVVNGLVSSVYDETRFKSGDYVAFGEPVAVVCNSQFSLALNQKEDNDILCRDDGTWEKQFPQCEKLCSYEKITGRTIASHCERNEFSVACDAPLKPGTKALINCKDGYTFQPGYSATVLMCQPNGEWDKAATKCIPICGQPTAKIVPFIVGGKDAEVLDVPWHVAIYKNYTQVCGGTILSERLILSAAHCFSEQDMETGGVCLVQRKTFKIVAGKTLRDYNKSHEERAQTFNISEIRIASFYGGYRGNFAGDLAIIVLDGVITYNKRIAPICIDYSVKTGTPVPSGTLGLAAGWGYTEDGIPSETLKSITLETVDYDQCKRESADFQNFVTKDKICAGNKDNSGVCLGDSGGGLVFPKISGNQRIFYIRGIVSNGKQAVGGCDLGFYTLFTNVQEYITMIKNSVEEYADENKPLDGKRGDWEKSFPKCHKPTDCKVPDIRYGRLIGETFGDNYEPGDYVDQSEAVMMVCDDGFFLEVKNDENSVNCVEGQWDKPLPQCHTADSCKIPDVDNGVILSKLPKELSIAGGYVDTSDTVSVTCNSIYSPPLSREDDKYINCQRSQWNKGFPTCLKFCKPSKIRGITIQAQCTREGKSVTCESALWPGTKASITCKTGYRFPANAPSLLTCGGEGEWDLEAVRCETICGNPRPPSNSIFKTKTEPTLQDLPWTALVFKKGRHTCTATIVSEKLLITAARHFFIREEYPKIVRFPKEAYKILIGKRFRNQNTTEQLAAQSFGVADVRAVPSFVGIGQFFLGNTALIVLDKYIVYKSYIAPVCMDFSIMPEKVIPPGSVGLSAGWGYTAADEQSEVLQQILLPVGDTKACAIETGPAYKKFLTPDKFCSGYANGTGLCNIDPGASVVFKQIVNGLEVAYVRGIVSNNRISERCNYPFYAFSTDIYIYGSFLKKVFDEFVPIL